MMKKTLLSIIILIISIPIIIAAEIPKNSQYISPSQAEEEILGNWYVINYYNSYNCYKYPEGSILRFEENYVYSESLLDGDYIQGEWQIIEHLVKPYIILWPDQQIFKIVFQNNNLYLINSVGNYFELERILD